MTNTQVATVEPLRASQVAMTQTHGGAALLPRSFGEVMAFSEAMSRSQHAIPKHLRGNAGACMAVAMQALRWEMDPFAVAAKSYNVNDMIAYEAQLIAAVVHTRAPIARRPEYEFTGEGENLRCTVACEMQDGSRKVYESPRVGEIRTKNSPLWKADPQQQLGYYSIRSWARRYTPEVLLGVYAPDELDERGPDAAREVNPPGIAARLTGGGESGFSQQHVDREIDGSEDIIETDAAEVVESGPAEQDDTTSHDGAASEEPGLFTSGVDDSGSSEPASDPQSRGEDEGQDDASSAARSEGEGLPLDVLKSYAKMLWRASSEKSLKDYIKTYWNENGGFPPEGTEAFEEVRAVNAVHLDRVQNKITAQAATDRLAELVGK